MRAAVSPRARLRSRIGRARSRIEGEPTDRLGELPESIHNTVRVREGDVEKAVTFMNLVESARHHVRASSCLPVSVTVRLTYQVVLIDARGVDVAARDMSGNNLPHRRLPE